MRDGVWKISPKTPETRISELINLLNGKINVTKYIHNPITRYFEEQKNKEIATTIYFLEGMKACLSTYQVYTNTQTLSVMEALKELEEKYKSY
jgi:hypothetical protein